MIDRSHNVRRTLFRAVRLILIAAAVPLSGCAHHHAQPSPSIGPTYYPQPPNQPRILYLGSVEALGMKSKSRSPMERFLFGSARETVAPVARPFGLAAHAGKLFVCDTHQRVVHVIDFEHQRWTRMGDRGPGRLLKPLDIAIDDAGLRYVADTHAIVVFSADGDPLRTLAPDTSDSFKPVAVAVHDGKLYVVNGAAHRVEVLDPQAGSLLSTFGDQGSGPERLLHPSGIAIEAGGRVYVADTLHGRVAVFTTGGAYLRSIGSPGDRAGSFARPKHLAVGANDVLYVVDAGFQRVQMFDEQGRILMLFGGPGEQPGAMILPTGICTDESILRDLAAHVPADFTAEYLVFVSDPFGAASVGIYAFGSAHR